MKFVCPVCGDEFERDRDRSDRTSVCSRKCASALGNARRSIKTTPDTRSRQWEQNNPEKRRAQKTVENALKAGRLERQPCERCGAEKVHAHHDDYSKPLDVMWLCPKHHRERHRELDAMAASTEAA
ncbi:hypothetical protein [Methyloceanibacter caenitepidi]|uniref:hypothetical protein n=1 Tax=Methyloceanibacter caenitepidi TaxID=1384459 RepID=UPI0012E0AA87|nr:hypothetical protein [Methyloceanibacter caenitepidi]